MSATTVTTAELSGTTTTTNAGLVVGIIAAIVGALVLVGGFCWCHQRYQRRKGRSGFWSEWYRRAFGGKQNDEPQQFASEAIPTRNEPIVVIGGGHAYPLETYQLDPAVSESNPYQYEDINFGGITTEPKTISQGEGIPPPQPLATHNEEASKVHPTASWTSNPHLHQHHRTASIVSNVPHHHQRVASTISQTGGGPTLTSSTTAINHQRLISGISTTAPTSAPTSRIHSRSASNIPQTHLVAVTPQQLLLASSNNSSITQLHHQRQLSLTAMPFQSSIGAPNRHAGVHHERLYSHLSISSSAPHPTSNNGNPRPPTSYDVSEAPLGTYVP